MSEFKKVERLVSLFDLEKQTMPGVAYLQQIIDSNIKFMKDNSDDLAILAKLFTLKLRSANKTVFCKKTLNFEKNKLKIFLEKIGEVEYIKEFDNNYEIMFSNEISADLCAISSSRIFQFDKSNINTNIYKLLKSNLIPHKGIYNRIIPFHCNKLILGPLNVDILDLAHTLDEIGPLFGIECLSQKNYFGILFYNESITKRFLQVIQQIKITSNPKFQIQFAYESCHIVNLPYWPVFISSYIQTSVVFLLDIVLSKAKVLEICENCKIQDVKTGKRLLTLIKCATINDSIQVYELLGGYVYKGKTLVSGFYQELCYEVEDF